tara:strand:- start:1941 stop:2315 length:375 start_codon:yes stop_codon:yes gene_type:complete
MSKVVNAIMATKEDRRRLKQTKLFQDVFAAREDIQTHAVMEIQYRIGVTLGAQCWVSETEILKNGGALEMAIERTKRQVIEAIFGEFRQDFRSIERALYDSNIEEARVMFHALEGKMFELTIDE